MGTEPGLTEQLERGLAGFGGLDRLRDAAGGVALYVVGGAVRDILLGRERGDLDVVVEGDAAAIARRLDHRAVVHDRFGTASVEVDGRRVDIARARTETYRSPGSLPEVAPATLDQDLARRDFTVNAMAVPLSGEARLIDPHGGAGDIEARRLRVLHPGSFADDPTRALRAARYAARLGFELDPDTEEWLRATDLSTVSADRVDAELRRILAEDEPWRAFGLALGWGVLEPDPVVRDLAAAGPERPSQAVLLARGRTPLELQLALAAGADWVGPYLEEWRHVRLEIGGGDLLAAGIPEGPAIGRGLDAALTAKLDGGLAGRDQELACALEAAGAS